MAFQINRILDSKDLDMGQVSGRGSKDFCMVRNGTRPKHCLSISREVTTDAVRLSRSNKK